MYETEWNESRKEQCKQGTRSCKMPNRRDKKPMQTDAKRVNIHEIKSKKITETNQLSNNPHGYSWLSNERKTKNTAATTMSTKETPLILKFIIVQNKSSKNVAKNRVFPSLKEI